MIIYGTTNAKIKTTLGEALAICYYINVRKLYVKSREVKEVTSFLEHMVREVTMLCVMSKWISVCH